VKLANACMGYGKDTSPEIWGWEACLVTRLQYIYTVGREQTYFKGKTVPRSPTKDKGCARKSAWSRPDVVQHASRKTMSSSTMSSIVPWSTRCGAPWIRECRRLLSDLLYYPPTRVCAKLMSFAHFRLFASGAVGTVTVRDDRGPRVWYPRVELVCDVHLDWRDQSMH
jgi:hypothetical protein